MKDSADDDEHDEDADADPCSGFGECDMGSRVKGGGGGSKSQQDEAHRDFSLGYSEQDGTGHCT